MEQLMDPVFRPSEEMMTYITQFEADLSKQ